MAEKNNIELKEDEQTLNTDERAQLPEPSEAEIQQSKIIELENSVNQYKDQLLRKAAEFENYKKRVENDYNTMVKFSNESLILELLPALDDFNRSMKALQNNQAPNGNSTNNDSFKQGIELIYNKLKKLLENQGVKEFESIGKPFDPYYHDALL
jgi:molecular chaperone GrpE